MPLGATRFGFSAGEIPLEVEYLVMLVVVALHKVVEVEELVVIVHL